MATNDTVQPDLINAGSYDTATPDFPKPLAGAAAPSVGGVLSTPNGNLTTPYPAIPQIPQTAGDLPDTAAATAGSSDTQAGILTPQAKVPPSTQGDINKILDPYINELLNLGPEYGKEMEYLKPYLMQTGDQAPKTFQQIESASKADESPTGSKTVNEADANVASTIANEPAPGFGNLAQAAKQYEGTVPYSDILQTVLGAGKNEILYGTQPNLTNVKTGAWPETLQQAYQFLTQASTGQNSKTGLTPPTVAAATKTQQPNTGGSTGGGTNN